MNGLRPFEEIKQLVGEEACQVKHSDPRELYQIEDLIGQGGFAKIFKCHSKANPDHCVALKHTTTKNER